MTKQPSDVRKNKSRRQSSLGPAPWPLVQLSLTQADCTGTSSLVHHTLDLGIPLWFKAAASTLLQAHLPLPSGSNCTAGGVLQSPTSSVCCNRSYFRSSRKRLGAQPALPEGPRPSHTNFPTFCQQPSNSVYQEFTEGEIRETDQRINDKPSLCLAKGMEWR